MSEKCVYLHRDPETLEVVYVGYGSLGRAWDFYSHARSDQHRAWMEKLAISNRFGQAVEVVAAGLSREAGLSLERELYHTYHPKFNIQEPGMSAGWNGQTPRQYIGTGAPPPLEGALNWAGRRALRRRAVTA